MSATAETTLPKNFSPAEAEPRWREFWAGRDLFRADNASPSDPYSIVIPPPNVTGALHLGHGLVQTIQDILIRHHRMAGNNTLWVPGTDHAGIATQHVVVEKLRAEGRRREELGREGFVAEVWKWKEQYHARISGQIRALGCSCDWSREAFTMDEERSRAVRVAFKQLYDKGLIYRGPYMVNWDPVQLTALADDEVDYEDEEGSLWHLKYPYADGSGRFAVVATTRPETMLGDTAVAVNPADERYKDAVGAEVELPLTGRRIRIIADDFVKADFGSGMVKITPAHDPNDFACAQRHNLPLIDIFTPDAKISDAAPEAYRGLDRYVARERVLADLKAAGLLLKVDKHPMRVGRGYRSKAVIEPRVSEQWFVKVAPLAERAARAVREGDIRIVPKAQETTYFHWMDNLRDWCISRQLWWGHRIPVWHHKAQPGRMVCWDGDGLPPEVAADPAAWEQDNDVLDTWFSSALWPFSTMGWPDTGARDLGVYFPTSVLVTGHDILFFWVARMIMFSYEFTGQRPFKDVFLHGLIFGKSFYRRRGSDLELVSPAERDALKLDESDKLPSGIEYRWEKMSKSKGNVIDPVEMFGLYGADSVRIALAAYSGQGRTIEIDRKRIEGYRNFINKVWNASRFVLTATEGLSAADFRAGILPADLRTEDRWILASLSKAIEAATRHLRAYEFTDYVGTLYRFFWDEYCDWYVELVKLRAYNKDNAYGEASSRAARVVLLTVLEQTLRLLHPAIPYATEEIWQLLRRRLAGAELGQPAAPAAAAPDSLGFRDAFHAISICVAPWPDADTWRDDAAERDMEFLKAAIGAIRNIRGEMLVPLDVKVEVLAQHPDAGQRALLESARAQVGALANVKSLDVKAAQPAAPFASTFVSGDLSLQVLLPEELRQAEVGRLEKEIAKLQKGLEGAQAKLGNEKFTGSAPSAVVEAERAKLAKYEADIAALAGKLAALR